MNIPMMLINLFFIPMISMMLYYKRNKKKYIINGEFIFRYSVYTAVIPTISKIFILVVRKVFNLQFDVDSSYYAMIASIVAFVLPYVVEIINKNVSIRCEINSQETGNKDET